MSRHRVTQGDDQPDLCHLCSAPADSYCDLCDACALAVQVLADQLRGQLEAPARPAVVHVPGQLVLVQ